MEKYSDETIRLISEKSGIPYNLVPSWAVNLVDELNNKKANKEAMNEIYQKYRSLGKWECSRKCMAAILKTQAGGVLKLEPTRC